MTWLHSRGKPWTFDLSFRTSVAESIKGVVGRAETLACKLEREQVGIYWIAFSALQLTSHHSGRPKSHFTQREGDRPYSQKPRGHLNEPRQFDENDGDLRPLVLGIHTCVHHAIPVRYPSMYYACLYLLREP